MPPDDESEPHRPRPEPLPPIMRSAADQALDEAMARGDFNNLPLAGKPLPLRNRDDPNWWIRARLEEGDLDRDALLPVVMLLRREADQLEDTLAALTSEDDVRAYAEDFTSRVLADRTANPLARMLAPTLDPDLAVDRWRRIRGAETR